MELLWQPHVDVHTLLRQTVLLLESKIREKALHVDLHLSLSPLSVGGDATRLQQVFWVCVCSHTHTPLVLGTISQIVV